MPVTKATGKHQLFLSPLLLPNGLLPNIPPTLIYFRERGQEKMKTSDQMKIQRDEMPPPKKRKHWKEKSLVASIGREIYIIHTEAG